MADALLLPVSAIAYCFGMYGNHVLLVAGGLACWCLCSLLNRERRVVSFCVSFIAALFNVLALAAVFYLLSPTTAHAQLHHLAVGIRDSNIARMLLGSVLVTLIDFVFLFFLRRKTSLAACLGNIVVMCASTAYVWASFLPYIAAMG